VRLLLLRTRTRKDLIMHQEFDDDLSTPTEADLTSCYGSKYLSAEEVGDRKIRTKIAKVWMDELQRPNGKSQKRFLLGFTTVDKALVLNMTNKATLVDALGRNPANWIGAEIGLLTEATMMSGKPTRGVRMRVLNKPLNTAPAPKPAPAPAAVEPAPWPDEAGDPGPDIVDFGEAAE
jgi:hypothetical protein